MQTLAGHTSLPAAAAADERNEANIVPNAQQSLTLCGETNLLRYSPAFIYQNGSSRMSLRPMHDCHSCCCCCCAAKRAQIRESIKSRAILLRQCAHSNTQRQWPRRRWVSMFTTSKPIHVRSTQRPSIQQPATIIISKLNVTPTRDTITNISTVSHL